MYCTRVGKTQAPMSNKHMIDTVSRVHHITPVKYNVTSCPAVFFSSHNFDADIILQEQCKDLSIYFPPFTHLSCSLMELIYHCVYCMPHSSRFMLWQYKRQQSREVLRTVFVCHRVPFLIPQAPALPAGAVCGGGKLVQSTPSSFFPAALKVAWGMGCEEEACLIP